MEKKLLQKKVLYPIVILLLILTVFIFPALTSIEVTTAEVRRGSVREYVFEDEAETRLDALRTVSAPLRGTVRRIELQIGDPVEAGEVITTIEEDEILHAIAGAEAKVRELEANIEGLPTKVPKESELKAAAESTEAAAEAGKAAELEKEKAAEELEYQRKEYRRISGLHDKDVVSDERYDLARLNLELARRSLSIHERYFRVAEIETRIAALELEAMKESLGDIDHLQKAYKAGIEQIRAELQTLHHQAGKTRIESPISGVLTEKYRDSEAAVEAGEPLFEVGDLDTIEIKADILSADISLVEPGQKVIIEGEILGEETLTGTVRRTYPHGFTKISALGIEQQRFRTIIDFNNTEARLPPGADLDVRVIIDQREDVTYIPSAAFFMTQDGPAVFVVENGRARIRHIETGLSGDEKIEVLSGLDEGDIIILRPPPELEPGNRVSAR